MSFIQNFIKNLSVESEITGREHAYNKESRLKSECPYLFIFPTKVQKLTNIR